MAETARRRVLLGITGGIAAYKAAELTRLLIKDGIEVQVVMTKAACGFVSPATFQALSGNPVYMDMWDPRIPDNMGHIALSRGTSLIAIAPASADFMAKIASGIADDLLTTLCLARDCPLLMAPAMNKQMWENSATRRNAAVLANDGITLLGPGEGDQACGETGLGRMIEPDQIFEGIVASLQPKLLAGKRVLITAGPTFEAIDPVRGITNRSSGKMGYAIAQAALGSGAQVKLISGPASATPPAGARVDPVQSANEMFQAVKKHAKWADIFIGVAAVADYRVEKISEHKIKKSDRDLVLKLVPNPDILGWIAALPKPPFCVGFAAESQKLTEFADAKRRRKKVPLMVANLAQDAIGADDNEVTLIDDQGMHRLPRAPKPVLARLLIAEIAARIHPKRARKG